MITSQIDISLSDSAEGRWRATRPGNVLQEWLRRERAMKGKKLDILQFTSPFLACVRNPWSQFALFAMSGYLLFYTYSVIVALEQYGVGKFKQFRVDVMRQNPNESSPSSPYENVTTAGAQITVQLLKKGCVVWSQNLTWMGDNHAAAYAPITFSDSLEIDGFSTIASNESVGYLLLGSNDNGLTWKVAGSSIFRFVPEGVRFLNLGSNSAKQSVFDFRPPWPLFAEAAIDAIIMAVGCITVASCGALRLKRHSIAEYAFVFCCSALTLNSFVVGVGYLILKREKEAFLPFVATIIYFLLSASLIFAKRFFVDTLTAVALGRIVCRAISDCSLFNDCSCFADFPPYGAISFTAVGAIFILLRHRFLLMAVRGVIKDRARYDAEWERFVGNPMNREGLARLEKITNRMAEESLPELARQFNRLLPDQPTHGRWSRQLRFGKRTLKASKSRDMDFTSLSSLFGEVDSTSPLSSLDQLYSQATGVVDIMYSMFTEWSAASRGSLDSDVRGEVLAKDLSSIPACLRKWMKLSLIKPPSRAIQKALVCFSGDVSRLVDVCRGRIQFDRISDLCTCLQIIHSQAEKVKIVRVKNSMLAGSDSWMGAGFRGVILNLCFETEDSKVLGIEHHVCELQLVLRRLFSWEGRIDAHLRFLNFRAVRVYARRFRWHQQRVWHATRSSLVGIEHGQGDVEYQQTALQARAGLYLISSTESTGSYCDRSSEEIDIATTSHLIHSEYLRSVHTDGGILDCAAQQLKDAFALSSAGSAWFSRKPIAAAADKPLALFLQLVSVSYFIFRGVQALKFVQRPASFRAEAMRFSVLAVRDAQISADSANISLFGPLKDGCRFAVNGTFTHNGSKVQVEFDKPIDANGFFFVTSAGETKFDPVLWIAETSLNTRSSWQPLGRARTTPYGTPEARNEQIDFDSRISWQVVMILMTGTFEYALALVCCMAVAIAGKVHWVKWIQVTVLTFGLLCNSAAAIGFQSEGEMQAALSVWIAFCAATVFVGGIAFFEQYLLIVLFAHAFSYAFTAIIINSVLYNKTLGPVIQHLAYSPCATSFLLGCMLVFFRRRVLVHARRLVQEDTTRYQQMWASILVADHAYNGLLDLQSEVRRLLPRCSLDVPRQCNRQMRHAAPRNGEDAAPQEEEDDCLGIPGTCDLSRPVTSLDQLFVQATLLHPILLSKVKEWASASGGIFQASDGRGYVRSEEARLDPNLLLKFSKVKSVSRAVEKIYRSYSQDVSRLVDLCRQSIILESPSAVAECLRVIVADPDTVVVRIKNRYDVAYQGDASCGYRDLGLNLRLVGGEPRSMGVETHVCEVQLLLKPFAELKSDEGHKRYITFRNLRGE